MVKPGGSATSGVRLEGYSTMCNGLFGLGGVELCVSKTVKVYTEECLHFEGNWELLKQNVVDETTYFEQNN